MKFEELKKGDEIFFAGNFYEVAEAKIFPGNLKMIGIYDEPPSKHIDYLNPSNVYAAYPCNQCQGGGCPYCSGYGRLIGNIIEL